MGTEQLPPGSEFLSEASQYIDTSEIRRVFDLASKLENPVNLSIGQPDFPVPEPVKEALIQAVKDNKNAYTQTQGLPQLREKLAAHYADHHGLDYHPENILVSTGVASILYLLFETVFNRGDGILLIDPYFLIHEGLSEYHRLKKYYLREDFSDTTEVSEQIKKDGTRLKMVLIATPSNPTGRILSTEQIRALAAIAREHNAMLVSDEIYAAYDFDGRFSPTALEYPEGTLTLSGFSKSHAMTGLRVGCALAPEKFKAVVNKMATIQQYSIVCSPQPSQWAAMKALDTPVDNELAIMKKRRDLVVSLLDDKISYSRPDGAFYLFAEVGAAGLEVVEEALKENLMLVPGHIFSRNRNTVRLSYARSEEELERGIEIFNRVYRRFL